MSKIAYRRFLTQKINQRRSDQNHVSVKLVREFLVQENKPEKDPRSQLIELVFCPKHLVGVLRELELASKIVLPS